MLFDLSSVNSRRQRGVEIPSLDEMRAALSGFLSRRPGIVEIDSPIGTRLQIGLGGPISCAQYFSKDGLPPYFCAKARSLLVRSDVEFLLGGTPTPVVPEQCITTGDALRIAEHFFLTGEREPGTEWVDV